MNSILLAISALIVVGCSVDTADSPQPDAMTSSLADGSPATIDAALPVDSSLAQLCVDELNEKRRLIGVPALTRVPSKESCVLEECQMDLASNTPHGSFGHCGESNQSQCAGSGWSADGMIEVCINDFYEEGPGPGLAHAHYAMLADPIYTSVACGIIEEGNELWFIVDYFQ